MVLSLAPLSDLFCLVRNKNKLDNEMPESLDGSLQTEKTLLKFITKTKQN